MAKIRWVTFRDLPLDGTSLIAVTQLRLRRKRSTFKFLAATRRVEAQLRLAEGLYAYSLKADLWSGTFWTLSQWPDQAALRQFVSSDPHRQLMVEFKLLMFDVKTASWEGLANEVPLTWDRPLEHLGAA